MPNGGRNVQQFIVYLPGVVLGGNPFKGKTPAQIDDALRKKVLHILHNYIDKGGKYKKGTELPHVDVHRPSSSSLPKKKLPLGNRR